MPEGLRSRRRPTRARNCCQNASRATAPWLAHGLVPIVRVSPCIAAPGTRFLANSDSGHAGPRRQAPSMLINPPLKATWELHCFTHPPAPIGGDRSRRQRLRQCTDGRRAILAGFPPDVGHRGPPGVVAGPGCSRRRCSNGGVPPTWPPHGARDSNGQLSNFIVPKGVYWPVRKMSRGASPAGPI
jgi:hypothetical protein